MISPHIRGRIPRHGARLPEPDRVGWFFATIILAPDTSPSEFGDFALLLTVVGSLSLEEVWRSRAQVSPPHARILMPASTD